MKILNENEYNELVLNAKGPVFVDFFAEWCGPCRMLTPILEEVSNEVDIPVYKVNIDECEDIARNLGIMSIPTMILFVDGKEKEKLIGLRQKQEIVNLINNY